MKKSWLLAFGIVTWLLLMATPAWAVGGVVTPNTVTPGGTVTVTGSAPGCPVIILQGISVWANTSGFVVAPHDPAGHFSVRARLNSTVSLGFQSFLIRCAQRNERLSATAGAELGGASAQAPFTVVGLAHTGGSIGVLSDTAAVAMAVALVAFGCTTVLMGRRRNTTRD